jgi:hypothetical protein
MHSSLSGEKGRRSLRLFSQKFDRVHICFVYIPSWFMVNILGSIKNERSSKQNRRRLGDGADGKSNGATNKKAA